MSDFFTTPFAPQMGSKLGSQIGQTRVVFSSLHTVAFNASQYHAKLRVTYRPEKLLIEKEQYEMFINLQLQKEWPTPENLMDALVNQLYDTLVPFSVDARLTLQDDTTKQTITARKQQPENGGYRNKEF